MRTARLRIGLRGGRVRGDVAAGLAAEQGLRVRAVAPRRAHASRDGMEERVRGRRASQSPWSLIFPLLACLRALKLP